jgi:hypothetical protein
LTVATWILAFATAFLFAAAVGQVFLFFWQLRLIGESLRDAKIAAEAAKESADATKIQAMVARDTLTKVQRPYVFVFGVNKIAMNNLMALGISPFVNYVVANYGQTPAIIENVGAGFDEGELPHVPLRVDDSHSLFVSPVLSPGDRRQDLRELLPEAFIDEDLGIVVDITTGLTRP